DLLDGGWRPVLAHPERYRYFWKNPRELADIAAMGVLLQVTTGSLIGEFGREPLALAERPLRPALTAIAAGGAHHPRPPGPSRGHPPGRRGPSMAAGGDRVAALVGAEAAERLTRGNPAAMLADGDVEVTGDPARLRDDDRQQSFLGAL